jgi:hypothetical protein
MFKLHTRPTFSKSANSLFGCCLFADDSPLTHICSTSLASVTTDSLRNSPTLEHLRRYSTFLFDSVMVMFKMTCRETGVQKWTTCRIHSRISANNSSQWPSFFVMGVRVYADWNAILLAFSNRYTFCILILIRKWERGYEVVDWINLAPNMDTGNMVVCL